MRLRLVILSALGVALALYLVMYVGWRGVLAAAIAVGWGGFVILCLVSLMVFGLLGVAWQVLFPSASAPAVWLLIRARMVRDSAAEVLPFSQLGGIALGVRAAILQGMPAPLACASVIVDVTAEMVAQIAYCALGLTILVAHVPQTSRVASLTRMALLGLAVAAVAAVLFVVVQRQGRRITARLATSLLRGAGRAALAACEALEGLYRAPARVALAALLHFTAWIVNAGSAWVAFHLIGAHVSLPAVIAIESLVYAARSAAALVPNALGVQEAAYAVLAPLFGVAVDLALAVSVLKRARDIAVGVPVLLVWQAAEGRRALAAGPGAGSDKAPT
jgi:glycosyltransferase 2 family protein